MFLPDLEKKNNFALVHLGFLAFLFFNPGQPLRSRKECSIPRSITLISKIPIAFIDLKSCLQKQLHADAAVHNFEKVNSAANVFDQGWKVKYILT